MGGSGGSRAPLSLLKKASSHELFHSDFALGKYPRHSRNLCTLTFKISSGVLPKLWKIFCFFTCVLFLLFCIFLTRLVIRITLNIFNIYILNYQKTRSVDPRNKKLSLVSKDMTCCKINFSKSILTRKFRIKIYHMSTLRNFRKMYVTSPVFGNRK